VNKTELFVVYKDINIYRIRFEIIHGDNTGLKLKRCVMCGKHIQLDKPFSLLLNNTIFFPNVMIHDKCVFEDKLQLIDNIIHRYNIFKQWWDKRDIWMSVFE